MAMIKKNNFMSFIIISYLILLIGRVPMYHMIGTDGMTFFCIAQGSVLLVGGAFFYSMREGMASLIRYRVRREQFKRIRKLLVQSCLFIFLFSMALTVALEILLPYVIGDILQLPLAIVSVRVALLGIPLLAVAGTLQGYFQGFHLRAPGIHADFIFAAVFLVVGFFSVEGFLLYGQKVAGLLHNDRFRYEYGAIGASFGLLAACAISLLYAVILYFMFRKNLEKDGERARDYLRNGENFFSRIRLVLGSGLMSALFYIFFAASDLVSAAAFLFFHNGDSSNITDYGLYYTGCQTLLLAVILFLFLLFHSSVRRIVYYQEHEEVRLVREKLSFLIHRMMVILLPFVVIVAVLSDNLSALILGETNESVSSAMQISSIGILLGTAGFVYVFMLLRLKKNIPAIMMAGGSLVLQIVLLVITMSVGINGMQAVALSKMGFFLLLTVLGFMLVSRETQYRQDWIRGIAVPIALAAIMGLMIIMMNRFLTPSSGRIVGTIVCTVVGILIYLVLLLLSRNLKREELSSSMIGKLLLRVGELARLY